VEVNPFILSARASAAPPSTAGCASGPDHAGRPSEPRFSLVVPVFDEADNVHGLLAEIAEVLLPHGPLEALLVDDGSRDASANVCARGSSSTVPTGLRIVCLQRNCGQSAAVLAGVERARAAIVATLDGDLQNDPRDLPRMLQRVEAGECDMVAGVRRQRHDTLVGGCRRRSAMACATG